MSDDSSDASDLDFSKFGIQMESEETRRRREALKAKQQQQQAKPVLSAPLVLPSPGTPIIASGISSSFPTAPPASITTAVVAGTQPTQAATSEAPPQAGAVKLFTAANLLNDTESDTFSTASEAKTKPVQQQQQLPPNVAGPSSDPPGGALPLNSNTVPPPAVDVHSPRPSSTSSEEEVGVWLCDRGIQTECTSSTQTDPEPPLAVCPLCYARHKGMTMSPDVMASGMVGGGMGNTNEAAMYMQMVMMLRAQLDDVQRTLARIQR
eukprot:PhF_6_TR37797/c0_g1_i1/m.56274